MISASHLIGRLEVHAAIPDIDTALALRPRLEALGWQLMPRVLEKIFDALAPSDLHLRLARLDLDLGVVRPDHLEEDALAALESALSEAISHAILSARRNPTADARLIAAPAKRMEEFETYLVTGLSPLGSRSDPFDPFIRLLELADTQPAALVAMLRRRSGDRHVLERLVLQAGEPGLRTLLDLLAPADAATILSLLADVLVAHRAEPKPPAAGLPEPELEKLLWVTTLEFLLRDAGSQFNRRRFLAFLLEREAARTATGYLALLSLLDDAVRRARAKGGFRSSLPVVLSDLLAEFRPNLETGPAETKTEEAAFAAAGTGDFGPLLALLDHRTATRPALDAILYTLPAPVFAGLVRHLSPDGATSILRTLDGLAMLHSAEALLPLSEGAFERLIRSLGLRGLLQASHRRFDRQSWLRLLVERLAGSAGIPVPRMLGVIDRAMRRSARVGTAGAGLQGLWSEIAVALATERSASPAAVEAEEVSPADEAITDPDALAHALDAATPEYGSRLLRRAAANPTLLMRLVATMTETERLRLLGIFDPLNAAAMATDLRAIVRLHGAAPLGTADKSAFEQFAWVLALTFLSNSQGGRFERRTFLRYLVDGGARFLGLAANEFATSLRRGSRALELAGAPADASFVLIDAVARERLEDAALPSADGNVGAADRSGSRRNGPVAEEAADADAVTRTLDAAGSEDAAAVLRRVAADPALLMRVVVARDEAGRLRFLSILDPVNAGLVAADLRVFVRLHAAVPLVTRGAAEFGRLVWMLALNYLSRSHGEHFDRYAFWRHLLDETARHGDMPVRDLASAVKRGIDVLEPAGVALASPYGVIGAVIRDRLNGFDGEPAHPEPQRREPPAPHWQGVLEHFLRTGQPQTAGRSLPGLVEKDPTWLAGLIRRLSRETPGAGSIMLDRLLEWLLPMELLNCLAPDRTAQAMHWADGLAGDALKAWRPVFAALLRDETPAFAAVPGGPGGRLDRLASIAHWLEHGAAPWWSLGGDGSSVFGDRHLEATDRSGSVSRGDAAFGSNSDGALRSNGGVGLEASGEKRPSWPLTDLHHLTLAELSSLFLAAGPERTLARLWQAVQTCGPGQRMLLLERLAPWATNAAGPLAPVLAELGEPEQLQVMVRAAAAALEGSELDLNALIGPAPPPGSLEVRVEAPVSSSPVSSSPVSSSPVSSSPVSSSPVSSPPVSSSPASSSPVSSPPDAGLHPAAAFDQRAGDQRVGRSSPPVPAVDPARLYAWLDGADASADESAALVRCFAWLADSGDRALADYLQANRSRASARARWARRLPQEALGRLVHILVPADARALLDATMVLSSAWRQVAPYSARRPNQSQLWTQLLDLIAAPGPIDLAAAMEGLARGLTKGDAGQTVKLRTRTERLARDGGYVSVTAALRRAARPVGSRASGSDPASGDAGAGRSASSASGIGASATGASGPDGANIGTLRVGTFSPGVSTTGTSSMGTPSMGRRQSDRPRPNEQVPAADEPGHAIFIGNAGLVLFNPYLPMLFERLGVLTPTESGVPRIQGVEAASRAVHLLQYLVDERLNAPEPLLALNKVICGLPTALPIARSIEPVRADLDLCDGLLQAVIANWPILRNTSPAGLRETFLQRDGRLVHADGRWNLRVQRKTLDVLTDQVPWSFSLVYHRWMIDPIHVTW